MDAVRGELTPENRAHLDAFARMPAWQRPWWIADMQQMGPDTLLVHEGSGPDFLHALAVLYVQQKQWDRAAPIAQQLITMYPTVPDFHRLMRHIQTRGGGGAP